MGEDIFRFLNRPVEETPGEDAVRLQREAERREKWGQLRAREQPSKRPRRTYRIFGYSDLSKRD